MILLPVDLCPSNPLRFFGSNPGVDHSYEQWFEVVRCVVNDGLILLVRDDASFSGDAFGLRVDWELWTGRNFLWGSRHSKPEGGTHVAEFSVDAYG